MPAAADPRKQLSLHGLGLTALPPEIGKLTKLRVLYLGANHLTTLPPEIGQLKSLEYLAVDYNRLSHLPASIGQLIQLQQLYLSENQLATLPPTIGNLTSLKVLAVKENRLVSLPSELRLLRRLGHLSLAGNPKLELSPSVLGWGEDFSRARVRSILDFYFKRKAGRTRPLNEVKLILVGRGGAGKTSTVRALLDKPFREGEEARRESRSATGR